MAMTLECGVAPATRGWRLRGWRAAWAEARARAAVRASLSELPEHLRQDVGLEGGMPLARFHNGGRTFISHGCPDSTLSGWHW
ncbi:MAG TPA: hypothetical protein PLL33_12945 [Paracoccus sp. (in: a-proteobacteria)]|nr:hypothetical protein [Paracoccus sp. (in: a-proteobacteria)]